MIKKLDNKNNIANKKTGDMIKRIKELKHMRDIILNTIYA